MKTHLNLKSATKKIIRKNHLKSKLFKKVFFFAIYSNYKILSNKKNLLFIDCIRISIILWYVTCMVIFHLQTKKYNP